MDVKDGSPLNVNPRKVKEVPFKFYLPSEYSIRSL
jgi:hypothetical protein